MVCQKTIETLDEGKNVPFLLVHSAQCHFQHCIILLLTDSGHIPTAIQGEHPNELCKKKQHKVLCLQQYGSCCSDTERKTTFKKIFMSTDLQFLDDTNFSLIINCVYASTMATLS